jgi:hypothetical protein
MASRRGAVKINPVTGKMEKADTTPVEVSTWAVNEGPRRQ